MNVCELCDRVARMYCESDQARLCWECDAKVHGANFLVARHTRVLLCRRCQTPTPWKASGARLSPTVTVCERCYAGRKASSAAEADDFEGEAGEERMDEDEDDYEDDVTDTEEEGEEEEEEEGENQVVPWSPTSPPAESSSSREESSSTGRFGADLLKRMRENANFTPQHDISCSSSRWDHLLAASPPPVLFSTRSTACASLSSCSYKDRRRSLPEAIPPSAAPDFTHNHMLTSGDHPAIELLPSASRKLPI